MKNLDPAKGPNENVKTCHLPKDVGTHNTRQGEREDNWEMRVGNAVERLL